MPAILSKIFLTVASVMIALLISEFTVRALGLAPEIISLEISSPNGEFRFHPDPAIGYVPRPGAPDINSLGLRDVEYSVPKKPGVFRIAVLGDSFAYGYCNKDGPIPLADIFANVLEKKLSAAFSRPVEVVNLAVSGYSSTQQVALFEELLVPLEPDFVIVAYCLNDAWNSSGELRSLQRMDGWHSRLSYKKGLQTELVNKSHLFRWLWTFYMQVNKPQSQAFTKTPFNPLDNLTITGFNHLEKLTSGSNLETLVVVFPYYFQYTDYEYWPQHNFVNTYSREKGFEVLDLYDRWAKESKGYPPLLVNPCRGAHPNQRGHEVSADEVFKYIVSSGILQSRTD